MINKQSFHKPVLISNKKQLNAFSFVEKWTRYRLFPKSPVLKIYTQITIPNCDQLWLNDDCVAVGPKSAYLFAF